MPSLFWEGGAMGDGTIWFLLSCKRHLKKPAFLAVLFLIPFLLYVVSAFGKDQTSGIAVAVYAQEELGDRVAEALTELPGAFSFYPCSSEEELKRDVETGKAECGYVFPEDLREKLDDGSYMRSILIYSSPSTVLDSMSQEVVFSVLMEVYGPELLLEYDEKNLKSEGKIAQLYQKYKTNGSTFSFRYETADQAEMEENRMTMTFPVRGIGAVFLFVLGLFSASAVAEDEKKGLFYCIPYGKKWWYLFLGTAAPVLMGGAVVLLSLFLSGSAEKGAAGVSKEILVMAVYLVGVAAFSCILKKITGKREVLVGLIPVFLIGSLILCPVFLDAGKWIPSLRLFGHAFLPYYYLAAFQ